MLLFFLIPLFVLIAMAIKLTSRGPVFYSQMRVGRGGELFPFIKFRTMIPGADTLRADILGTPTRRCPSATATIRASRPSAASCGAGRSTSCPSCSTSSGARCRWWGRDRSFPRNLPLLDARHHERHHCRPGLTGLWQVSGRKETTWQERMDLDLAYVRQQSFATDVSIVRRTVRVVVRGEGPTEPGAYRGAFTSRSR